MLDSYLNNDVFQNFEISTYWFNNNQSQVMIYLIYDIALRIIQLTHFYKKNAKLLRQIPKILKRLWEYILLGKKQIFLRNVFIVS